MCKTGQPLSTSWRRDKKEHLFYRKSHSDYFWISRLFSFRTEEGRRAYVEEENEILQSDIEENSNNLVQKQEQVVVSCIASVVKASTYSYCSGKSRTSKTDAAAVAVENEPTMKSLN